MTRCFLRGDGYGHGDSDTVDDNDDTSNAADADEEGRRKRLRRQQCPVSFNPWVHMSVLHSESCHVSATKIVYSTSPAFFPSLFLLQNDPANVTENHRLEARVRSI